MPVIALAALVVIANYTLATAYKYQPVFVWVLGRGDRLRHLPDDNFDYASGIRTFFPMQQFGVFRHEWIMNMAFVWCQEPYQYLLTPSERVYCLAKAITGNLIGEVLCAVAWFCYGVRRRVCALNMRRHVAALQT